jgi:hypothetical protein
VKWRAKEIFTNSRLLGRAPTLGGLFRPSCVGDLHDYFYFFQIMISRQKTFLSISLN